MSNERTEAPSTGRPAEPLALRSNDLLGLAPERAGFEAWANEQGYPLNRIDIGGCDDYGDLRTEGAWEAWKAAEAAERERWRVKLTAHRDRTVMSCYASVRECEAARNALQRALDDEA